MKGIEINYNTTVLLIILNKYILYILKIRFMNMNDDRYFKLFIKCCNNHAQI